MAAAIWRAPRAHGHRLMWLACGLGLCALAACGGSGGGDAAAADSGAATVASLAQQTVGADLLPPDADIAGTTTVATDLPAQDLSPEAVSTSSNLADELPPV
jgi:hypothetical protein